MILTIGRHVKLWKISGIGASRSWSRPPACAVSRRRGRRLPKRRAEGIVAGGTPGILALVFSAGLLSFFSPCILPLLPVYAGSLTTNEFLARSSARTALAKALVFSAGLTAPLFLLGLGASALAGLFSNPLFLLACGILVVCLGLHQTGLITIPSLQKAWLKNFSVTPGKGLAGAFVLGFLFSFGWTPCSGPLLAAILGIAAQQGGILGGGCLLLVYSAGIALPFLVLALCSQQIFKRIKWIYPHFSKIRILGGILVTGMGGWMIFTQALLLLEKNG
jgi:cytochrome c biogenesis protein CcdA